MKINTKFDVPILNYQFEPNDEEYLEELMKDGITKHAASLMLGNNSIISQPSLMKKFEEKQSFTTLNERGQKVYFDINEAKISNINLFEEIGEQILQLRLFGFYNIKLLEIQKNYLTLSLSYLDNNGFVHSSNLLFCTLNSLNYKNVKNIYGDANTEQPISNALIFNDNLLLKNDYSIKEMLLKNGNILIDKNKYEFINSDEEIEVYTGSSFYNSQKFFDLIKACESEAKISVDEINKIHEFRLEKNGFDIARSEIAFDFANDKEKYIGDKQKQYLQFLNNQIKHDYLISLFTVTNNEISAYYDNYLLNKSFSEYLDNLIINMLNTKIQFNSFREFELAFKLLYYKKHKKDYISNEDISNKVEQELDNNSSPLVEVETFDDTKSEQQKGYAEQEQQESYAESKQQESYTEPEQQEGYTELEQQEDYAEPKQQESYAEPKQQEGYAEPEQQKEYTEPEQQKGYTGSEQQVNDNGEDDYKNNALDRLINQMRQSPKHDNDNN